MIDFSSSISPGGTMIIKLSGSLDLTSCEYFFDCVQDEIDKGNHRIVIDCSDLGYISSLGLGLLIRTRSRVTKKNGFIILAQLQNSVAEVLSLVHLDRIFQIYPTLESAVTAADAKHPDSG